MYKAIFKQYRKIEWDETQQVPIFDFLVEDNGNEKNLSLAHGINITFKDFIYSWSSRGRGHDYITATGIIGKNYLYSGKENIENFSLRITNGGVEPLSSGMDYYRSESRVQVDVEMPEESFEFLKSNIGIRDFYMNAYLMGLYSIYKVSDGDFKDYEPLQLIEFSPFILGELEFFGEYRVLNDSDFEGDAEELKILARDAYPNGGIGKFSYQLIFGSEGLRQ